MPKTEEEARVDFYGTIQRRRQYVTNCFVMINNRRAWGATSRIKKGTNDYSEIGLTPNSLDLRMRLRAVMGQSFIQERNKETFLTHL